jgi:hypothetical protein
MLLALAVLTTMTTAAPDAAGPVIQHTPVAVLTEATSIEATISDPSGVFDPTLLIRPVGTAEFTRLPMVVVPNRAGVYAAAVPPPLRAAAPLEYFIEVFDNLGNGPSHAGSEDAPLVIQAPVVATPTPAPVVIEDVREEQSSPWPVVLAVSGAVVGVGVLAIGGAFAVYALRPGDVSSSKLAVTGPSPVQAGAE